MSRARSAFLLVSAVAAAVSVSVAEESAVQTPGAERPAILAPTTDKLVAPTAVATPERPREISPTVAARLASAAPKYEAAPAPAPSSEPLPDLREIDKPRNTIVRLPPYLVPERKAPPVLKEKEVLTPKARLDLALRKFPGLRLGSFWIFSNDGVALALLEQEERLEKKREFEDLASLMRFTDPAAQAKVKQEVDRAFTRQADFGR